MRVWFSPRYGVDAPGHPFKPSKFAEAAALLVRSGAAKPSDLAEPAEAPRELLERAHTSAWVSRVLEDRLAPEDWERLEMSPENGLGARHALHVQATLEACRDALRTGLGLHCGGGGHHAHADRGTGYCVFNDLAAAAKTLLAEGVERVAVVDLDVHQGDGTASILKAEPRAFTLSMHQQDLFPDVKVSGSLDVGLAGGAGDEEYLDALDEALERVVGFRPALALYLAGADVHEADLKGGLKLTDRGLAERDGRVAERLRRAGIPFAVVLGGGYGPQAARLHAQTLSTMIARFSHV